MLIHYHPPFISFKMYTTAENKEMVESFTGAFSRQNKLKYTYLMI